MTIFCPVDPKDFINAPYGAFLKAVRAFDPDYGYKAEEKQQFVIEYEETRQTVTKRRAVVNAYSYEQAQQIIKEDGDREDGFVLDEEIDEDTNCWTSDFELVERSYLKDIDTITID